MTVGRGIIQSASRTGPTASRPDAMNWPGEVTFCLLYRQSRPAASQLVHSSRQSAAATSLSGPSSAKKRCSTGRTAILTGRNDQATTRSGLSTSRNDLSTTRIASSPCRNASSTDQNAASSWTTANPERSRCHFCRSKPNCFTSRTLSDALSGHSIRSRVRSFTSKHHSIRSSAESEGATSHSGCPTRPCLCPKGERRFPTRRFARRDLVRAGPETGAPRTEAFPDFETLP